MNKVVCIVRGGVVQEVYSNGEAEVKIIDLDNEALTDEQIKEVTKDLKSVY